jgi:hypothetical protein
MADEQVYIGLLQQMLSSKHFYYSQTVNLTKNLQQQLMSRNSNGKNASVDWYDADQYFLANRVPLAGIKVLDPSFPHPSDSSPLHQVIWQCFIL